MLSPSNILRSIYETIFTYKTASGRTAYKSNKRNYKIKMVKGKPTETLKVQPSPGSKKRTQRLYKSPAVIRGAVLKGKATKLVHKAMGMTPSKKGKKVIQKTVPGFVPLTKLKEPEGMKKPLSYADKIKKQAREKFKKKREFGKKRQTKAEKKRLQKRAA